MAPAPTVIPTTRIKIASGVLLVLSVPATIGSIPLAFVSLFSFDAPSSMSSLWPWVMFLTLMLCPILAVGAGAVALSNLGIGSLKMLIAALAMMLVPAGILLFVAVHRWTSNPPPPNCPARSFHVPAADQDPRCLSGRL